MTRTTQEESHTADRYQELAYRLVETKHDRALPDIGVVAFVSPHPQAGVTHVTRNLASWMNADITHADPCELTIALDCDSVTRSGVPFGQIVAKKIVPGSLALETGQSLALEARLNQLSGAWKNDASYRVSCVEALRGLFKFTLIDCRSLKSSGNIRSIAPVVDGVVVVVDADRTTRSQVDYLTKVIKTGRGRVLGYVLNRRTYPIPEGIYQTLERGGLT